MTTQIAETARVAALRNRLVREILAPATGLAPEVVDRAGSIRCIGLGSVDYVEIIRLIRHHLGVAIPASKLFMHHNINELAGYLVNRLDGGTGQEATKSVPQQFTGAPVQSRAGKELGTRQVAIIGVAMNLPGDIRDLDALWRHSARQGDAVTPIADSRPEILRDHLRNHSSLLGFPEYAAFTSDIRAFDAAFFGISPAEARAMDPQQRKMLELTWHVLEDAGYRPASLAGAPVGVHCAVNAVDYGELLIQEPQILESLGPFADPGVHPSMIANRVSRWFGFSGPSETYNTACSSSLVALHHAVRALRDGSCELAIAAGVNALLSARGFHQMNRAGMLSPDGRCAAFDHRGNGFVRAEGFVAVLLKPLERALKDGDRVLAAILGTAIGHDGRTDSLRAPNPAAQRDLVMAAIRDADVPAETISYLEAHGTGTALGDPIEFEGLSAAFQRLAPGMPEGSCVLGSVKTNLGHLEAAAGLAGVAKALACFTRRELPGLGHFERLNPNLDTGGSPFRIATANEPWQPDGDATPLRCGISSFGFGGANAHVILEGGFDAAPVTRDAILPVLLVLSSCTADGLRAEAGALAAHLASHPERDLRTTALGLMARQPLEERLALIASDRDEAIAQLAEFADIGTAFRIRCGRVPTSHVLASPTPGTSADAVSDWLNSGNLESAQENWLVGHQVPWDGLGFMPEAAGLPGHVFAKTSFWYDDVPSPECPSLDRRLHPLVAYNTSTFAEQRFRIALDPADVLARHRQVDGVASMPSSALLEAARFCYEVACGASGPVVLSDLLWAPEQPTAGPLDIVLVPSGDGADFDFLDSDGAVVCQGTIRAGTPATRSAANWGLEIVDPAGIAEEFATAGLRHGPAYGCIVALSLGERMASARIRLPETLAALEQPYTIQPMLLARALELAWLAMRREGLASNTTEPSYLGEMAVHQAMGLEADIDVRVGSSGCDITIRNEEQILATLTDVRFTEIGQVQR